MDWQAVLLTSVITSGFVSASPDRMWLPNLERKKQSTQLLLERLEKTITLLRAEYDGFSTAVNEQYSQDPFTPRWTELTLAQILSISKSPFVCVLTHLDSEERVCCDSDSNNL